MSFLFPFYSFFYYIIYYFLLFPYYFLIIPFKICFLSKFAQTIFYCALLCSILLYSHYQILCLSTYKIYIKIRGEDLVPCRGEGSPIPLISRRESARVRRGYSIVLPGVLCEGLCLLPSQRLPRPLAPYYKPARVRRGSGLHSE